MTTLNHYHKCIRKITAAFASLFNNVILIRDNTDGTENQRFIVPLDFGDKEKYLKRLQGDPDLDKKTQITLPRMSYQMTGFSYDSTRKLNTNNKNFNISSDADKVLSQFNPVPYDVDFSLVVYTRNIEDGNQILEQILPYFTPDYTLKINFVPEMGITRNVPIILNSIVPTIDSEGSFNSEVRTVYWTLNFSVKGFIFGAIKEVPIIKQSNTNIISNVFIPGGGEGSCCSGNISKSFIMNPIGYGNYLINEYVYQGINYDNSYASGKVTEWSNTQNILIISDVCGTFKLNQPIVGENSLSIRIPTAPAQNTQIDMKILTTPDPRTASANSYWVANTKILENQ